MSIVELMDHPSLFRRRPPVYPPRIYAAVVAGAIGLSLVIIGLAAGWWVLGPGLGLVVASLVGSWPVLASSSSRRPGR